MKIGTILRWVLRLILFLLLLVLVIDNIQAVQFNLFGIYFVKLPLILLAMLFLALGVLCGLSIGLVGRISLKAKIRSLEKDMLETLKAKARQDNSNIFNAEISKQT
jgi:uncharacterized integral membrane protein